MFSRTWKAITGILLLLTMGSARVATAQTADSSVNSASPIWSGVAAGAHAGTWLDQGSMGEDGRRDLIIGAPGGGATMGKVYILFGGGATIPAGNLSLSTAHVIISSTTADDGFGSVTANGNVLNPEGTAAKTLVVAAPNAQSGRGAVYVFATNYPIGERPTTANAVFRVIGNVGDRLGSSLATADIDGDGFRDIIMGAPGTNRVYVIYGGPTLSGARDLATTAADIRITGTGLGGSMHANDVTGDGIYDLLLGAPDLSLVYLIKGRSARTFPANMVLSSDEDAYFVAPQGERAGASIRSANLDGDSAPEIVIGAPGGAGDSGTVYLLWGRSVWTSTSLTTADVIFRGPWPGANLGQNVGFGDINRDRPNDLSMIVNGPSGGPQQLLAYYGRPRTEVGVPSGSSRIVDFSSLANVSRRVLGTAAAPQMSASLVYELTGEGARDIVVASPNASGDFAQSGRVFVVVSPRIIPDPLTVALFTGTGGSTSRNLSVTNDSTVAVTWAATPHAAWLSGTPGSGSTAAGAPGPLTVNGNAGALAPGVYTSTLDLRSTSTHLEMTVPVPVSLTVVSQPVLTANRTFPTAAGAPITWTATATAGGASLLYQFWRNDPSVGWHMVQDFSATNTYTWTPAVSDAGDHFLQAWVKAVGSPNRFDNFVGTSPLTVTRPIAALTSFQTNAAFPQPVGSAIRWDATATGGAIEYRFLLFKEGVGWSVLQEYGATSNVTWTPASTGSYALQVWVRLAGSTANLDDWRSSGTFTVSNSAPLQVVSLTSTPSGDYTPGAPITWRASASGGSAGPLQYKFWRFDQSTNSWTMLQDYSAASAVTWTPTDPADVGTHAIQVWVRSAGSAANFEAWMGTSMFTVARRPTSQVTLSSSRGFPAPVGATITWTGSATGGVAPVQYKFLIYKEGVGWSVLRDWSSSNSVDWTPTTSGTYALQVWARSSGSTATFEAWAPSGTFVIQ